MSGTEKAYIYPMCCCTLHDDQRTCQVLTQGVLVSYGICIDRNEKKDEKKRTKKNPAQTNKQHNFRNDTIFIITRRSRLYSISIARTRLDDFFPINRV